MLKKIKWTRILLLLLFLSLVISVPMWSQVPDDAAMKAFDNWAHDKADTNWDFPGEVLAHYKLKLRADGLSETQADVLVAALEKRIWADDTDFWNKNYSGGGPLTFTPEPNQTLVQAVKGRKPGNALDVEMGQGRNAVFLAQQGWSLTGFDISQTALSLAQDQAHKLGVTINTVLSRDIDFDFGKEQWDLIAIIYPMDRRSLPKVQSALRPGSLFVTEGFHEEVHGPAMRYRTNELLERFRGFRVYRYEEVIAKPDWGKSDVRVVKFVAEKPLTN